MKAEIHPKSQRTKQMYQMRRNQNDEKVTLRIKKTHMDDDGENYPDTK